MYQIARKNNRIEVNMKGEKLQSLLKRDIILSIMTRQKRKYAIVDLEATMLKQMLRSFRLGSLLSRMA